jgi:ribosome-associated toxin RatA of RatAB toxin-antitoxin module
MPTFSLRELAPADHAALPEQFVHTVDLDCSAEALFAVLEDPASWPVWAPGIGRVEWTSPRPFGVGTTRTVTFWGGTQVFERFTAWTPGRELVFTILSTTEELWTAFGEHYAVEPLGAQRCRLTWTVSYEATGGFGRAHRWVKPMMGAAFGFYMWRLRRYCRGR